MVRSGHFCFQVSLNCFSVSSCELEGRKNGQPGFLTGKGGDFVFISLTGRRFQSPYAEGENKRYAGTFRSSVL